MTSEFTGSKALSDSQVRTLKYYLILLPRVIKNFLPEYFAYICVSVGNACNSNNRKSNIGWLKQIMI
jgi:hypothetical protein